MLEFSLISLIKITPLNLLLKLMKFFMKIIK